MTKNSEITEISNSTKPVLGDVVQNKAKIGGAITALSRIQIQLMNVGLSNDDYNDISEMIGNVKERLANIA